ncbi:hypothetical protein Ptr902_00640 [Pyrenophora tritici-repentis]|nr:hypothetical protein Alg215_06801 [Pyrenophora tritici-repentis]KAI0591621.1 hypothetical protein Alg130_01091 [Pyrenophora tritici-repentis]KAI0626191.1 hypothetical protein TUN199_01812 [Pyrenophora tritici-repentis]KAI2486507.1 hypothetical protein Ptr902_00640 [Pyrenophora tritici-repentis]
MQLQATADAHLASLTCASALAEYCTYYAALDLYGGCRIITFSEYFTY